jgi:microcin C transport system substrate-binding protein
MKYGSILLVLVAACARADETFPRKGWKDAPNPFASPDAMEGGEFRVYVGPYPKSFNYYLDLNVFSAELFGAMYETLLSYHPLTLDLEPGLAGSWSVSDDKMSFTFRLRAEAAWSDGRPITAEDVKWTYSAITDPRNLTGPHKIDLERFLEPVVLDERTIRFTAREPHWKNLMAIGFFRILPRHVLAARDFNKVNFEFPVVSGRYRIGAIKEGLFATLERRDDWWNRNAPSARHTANFQTLRFMFFEDEDNAFEAFKKGSIDYFPVHKAHQWVSETKGDRFEKQWIVKQRVENYNPIGFQGFAMNGRRPPFDDVRVRKAMCHLLNRRKMNRTLMHDQYFLHRSYFEDLYDRDHPCPNPLIEFDTDAARALLKEAGWEADKDSGLLRKDGREFRFKFLTRDASSDKFLVIYKEDLRDVGIEMSIEQKDWAAWAKDMDAFSYDMTWAAWSGGLWKDPESMWSSAEADRPAGQNITGLKNAEVDELIVKQKTLFDLAARHDLCRRIDRIVCEQYPYVLLWNLNYSRLLSWNKFGAPDTVLGKYGDERAAYWYWWADPDADADLKDAMQRDLPLPSRPGSVRFDDVFR